jgi:hypothetical protein
MHTRDALDAQHAHDMAKSVAECALLLVKLHTYVQIQDRMIEVQDLLIERVQRQRDQALLLVQNITGGTQ